MNLENVLNQQIADFNVLYTKLHRFHWYVKGPQFFTLHEKFEEFYNETADYIDEYAERLLAIGGSPIATMKQFLQAATLSEDGNEQTSEEMVETLINDYMLLVKNLKNAVEKAEAAHDHVTADLFIGTIGNIEKHIWMLKAALPVKTSVNA
ncbi:Dps family protein [Priestia sp. YIM B13446]|jgi:starvation-inducible DNA-binding protein|nr:MULTISPECIES: DNA starvation/stationary phase protection protein [Priestia]RCX24480.1 starvation-inducible DNA-binding protein [Bacillus sp. AG236]KNH22154.1 general stress protein [Priestia megaterium]KWU57275.1 DNA starvation/stationary phase protection protein [Priestia megaterium]MBX9997863.1 DNA starvation/stationary phase protection protein [Priestia aryabhattai]MCP1447198.1 starvation-inducible DNA-binding protein [Priestia megaterium]